MASREKKTTSERNYSLTTSLGSRTVFGRGSPLKLPTCIGFHKQVSQSTRGVTWRHRLGFRRFFLATTPQKWLLFEEQDPVRVVGPHFFVCGPFLVGAPPQNCLTLLVFTSMFLKVLGGNLVPPAAVWALFFAMKPGKCLLFEKQDLVGFIGPQFFDHGLFLVGGPP